MPPLNVLFTSAGRRVELINAFKRAYAALELKGNLVAIDIDPLAPALRVAHRHYIVPRLTASAYIPDLIEICRREAINVIFPLIDPDIAVLAAHRAEIELTGTRLAVVSEAAAAITDDKWLTHAFFKRLGLTTPRSWLPSQLEPLTSSYPLFVKPRHGSASQHTYKVENARQLAFFCEYVPDPIVQEYLAGPEITSDVICDLDGDVMAVVSRQRIEVRWGEVAKGVTVYNPAITAACREIARALPAIGPITVQCILKEGVPHFTEINARLGGGVPLSVAAGVDSPRWLLARAGGQPVDIPPLGTYQTGLFLTRFDDSFFLDQTDYDRLASRHL